MVAKTSLDRKIPVDIFSIRYKEGKLNHLISDIFTDILINIFMRMCILVILLFEVEPGFITVANLEKTVIYNVCHI